MKSIYLLGENRWNITKNTLEDVLVVSGREPMAFDLKEAYRLHQRSGAAATVVVTRRWDEGDGYYVKTDSQDLVIDFLPAAQQRGNGAVLMDTGVYIMSPVALTLIPTGQKFGFVTHLFPKMLAEDMIVKAYEIPAEDLSNVDELLDRNELI